MSKIKNLFNLAIAAFAVAFASTTAFAGRYWVGAPDGDALFSTSANWSDAENGSGGQTPPDTSTSTTYWYGYQNGRTVFDAAATLAQKEVKVSCTSSRENPFVWSATDPLFGITAEGQEFQLGNSGSRSPSFLQIDSGTYVWGRTRIGYAENVVAGLTFNGGTFTGSGEMRIGSSKNSTGDLIVNGGTLTQSGELQIGYAEGATGTLVLNGGEYTVNSTARIGYANYSKADMTVNGGTFKSNTLRVSGKATGVNGTLTITGGLVQTTATGDDGFMVCNEAGTTGTVVIAGGTLDTSATSRSTIGGVADILAEIYVNTGGVWNTGNFLLGGKADKTQYDVANSVTRLYVNGGTINLTGSPSGIGYAVGEGSMAEMVLNDGDVTVTGTDAFYVGESGPGSFTMNGGRFTMTKTANGFGFGHKKTGNDVGTVTLNGGILTIWKIRNDYIQPGSKLIFNGGTVKPIAATTTFIAENENLTCIVDEGGLIFDTAGFDVTIPHALVAPEGKPIGPIIKKGSGVLTLSAPFDGEITVLRGSVVTNLVETTTQQATDPDTGEPAVDPDTGDPVMETITTTTPITISADAASSGDRYWLGATAEGVSSDTANWSTSSGGTPGASAPAWDYVGGDIYFNKAYENRVTVFDSAIEPVRTGYLYVGASTETPLVWRATLPYCGFSYIPGEWRLAYNADHKTANLTIDSGTYECSSYLYVGYTTGGTAKLVINGGNVTAYKPRVAGGKDNLTSTVIISNGTLKATESLHIAAGGKTGCNGTLIVDGGTLDTSVASSDHDVLIGQNNTQATALLQVKSGTWKTKTFLVGGAAKRSASNSYPGLHASLVVDGGTVTASGDCCIGANIAEDGRSEMIINGGSVNINANNLYAGDGGPGYLTVNGGELTMKDTDYGVAFGHYNGSKAKVDAGYVTLNGGTVTTPKFRVEYIASGSKLVFNGGTVKATRTQPDFIAETDALTCELQAGGLIFDTAGFDVTIAHAIETPEGVTGAEVVKKGAGELVFAGGVSPDGYIVEEGSLVLSNVTDTVFTKISVADGASLDLNGAEVTVDEYVVSGEKQHGGTYTAHNGTIHVKSGRMAIIR